MKPKKPIHYVITRELFNAGRENPEVEKAYIEAARQFERGEWGLLGEDDIKANDNELAARDGHVLGKYGTPAGTIYINLKFNNTEPEDTACIMFCSEY